MIERDVEGSAYGRQSGSFDKELTEVGAGTPCGELMRRYWHPIAVSAKVAMRPQKVTLLGEELILFRDGYGRPGLLTPRCAHRGASLYYGKVEEGGIRCCYHGWSFDVRGRCLDQPCEPVDSTYRERIRQPWYPVEDLYGLVFAYMGPPEKKPELPRWDVFEDLAPGETIYAHGPTGFGVGADDTIDTIPWNWLQDWENYMDPFHVPILHARHSAIQYVPEAANLPAVTFDRAELGMKYTAHRKTNDGRVVERVTLALLPNVKVVPDQRLDVTGPTTFLGWLVPVDDRRHRIFHAMRVPAGVDGAALFDSVARPRAMGNDVTWSDMSEAEHQQFPSDWEAQSSLGAITLHDQEHLATSDRGIIMLRRLLRDQIKLVQNGGDPIGVTFDPSQAVKKVESGNFFRPAEALA
jgi:phenylpropionate dioxygenase-like ring-hydroxylating dioxygenase large terminal subunit